MDINEMVNQAGSIPSLYSRLMDQDRAGLILDDVYRIVEGTPEPFDCTVLCIGPGTLTLNTENKGIVKYPIVPNTTMRLNIYGDHKPTHIDSLFSSLEASVMGGNIFIQRLDLSKVDFSLVWFPANAFNNLMNLTYLNMGNTWTLEQGSSVAGTWCTEGMFKGCINLKTIRCNQTFKDFYTRERYYHGGPEPDSIEWDIID